MDVETLRTFFGWCTVMNGALLVFYSVLIMTSGGWVYRMHNRLFPMTRESFTLAMYCFIGGMKLVVLMFNLVPYIALALVK